MTFWQMVSNSCCRAAREFWRVLTLRSRRSPRATVAYGGAEYSAKSRLVGVTSEGFLHYEVNIPAEVPVDEDGRAEATVRFDFIPARSVVSVRLGPPSIDPFEAGER